MRTFSSSAVGRWQDAHHAIHDAVQRRAVAAFRQLAGGTDPVEKATPGTIRGDFGLETQFNLVHGSDSAESAAREIALWFPAI